MPLGLKPPQYLLQATLPSTDHYPIRQLTSAISHHCFRIGHLTSIIVTMHQWTHLAIARYPTSTFLPLDLHGHSLGKKMNVQFVTEPFHSKEQMALKQSEKLMSCNASKHNSLLRVQDPRIRLLQRRSGQQ
ncbi:hypothetical protein P7C71_g3162, partial [Lecanoromycetidae sp. Uapishka_2]